MRSRWIFLCFAIATALICSALGIWQLRRLDARRKANALASAERSRPPRRLPGGGALAADAAVVATGSFDFDHEFVLRGRAHDGAPGVEIATPFRMAGTDTALIVLRGFVPSDDAMSVDRAAIREEGVRTVHGILFAMPETGVPLARQGDTTWDRIPGEWMRTHLPYPVHPFVLWQARDSGMKGFPVRLGAPALSDGPHLNYALQWFAFAMIFGGGGIAFALRKRDEGTQTPSEVSPGASGPTPTSGAS